MEKVDQIQLMDESVYPDEEVLKSVLGTGYSAFVELIKLYDDNQMTHEWRYYHDGKAWLCKVQKKKKTIVWMSAWKGYMKATIYIHEKDVEGVFALPLNKTTLESLRQAKQVGKSTACTFEVRSHEVLADFEKVMQYKIGIK